MPPRRFSSTAQRTTLANSVSDSAGTIIVASVAGFPSSRPYSLILDYETINEEIVEVTAASGTTLTVTRGVDGTTGVAHDLGAAVVHGITGRDLGEPQTHMYASEGVHGVTGDVVGTDGTQTLTGKSIDGVDNTFTNIPQSAVTGLVSALAAKAPSNSPTFTGTVGLPSTTSIGDVSATELGYLNNATSNIQAQLDTLTSTDESLQTQIDAITNDTGSGQTLPLGGVLGDLLVKQSSTDGDADWQTLLSILPSLTGNAGKILSVNGTEDGIEWVTVGSGSGSPVDVIAASPYPTGGTVTTYTDGVTGYDYRVHTFLYSGSPDNFTVTHGVIGTLLMVGGGGSGSNHKNGGFPIWGGGGGAGAMFEGVYAFGAGTHTLYVGGGGAATLDSIGADGEDTLFEGYPGTINSGTYIAYGGGGGGYSSAGRPGGSGGGGGGAWNGDRSGGAAENGSSNGGVTTDVTNFQGHAGSDAYVQTSAPGGGAFDSSGTGVASTITGSSVTYAKGGAAESGSPTTTQNTGSGGGAGPNGTKGSDGANGIVIIRYRTA